MCMQVTLIIDQTIDTIVTVRVYKSLLYLNLPLIFELRRPAPTRGAAANPPAEPLLLK
eukprot:COSAG06_NODE_185_length_20838_cov_50.259463_12_plen_58_part_00